jgi:pSer/pThr/pTyr-binding forkhead associated (FHA) protein
MTSIHDEGITSSSSSLKTSRLQGMKIRDEFLCPITYELLREPVVASDGHTYEKAAIEKWLRSNRTSPRSGQSMDDSLVKNTNMKKLIQDMIDEGGKGLYTNDAFDRERLFDVFAEKVIVLKCLGPPESDWNMQSFQVSHLGCIGGRKIHSEEANPTGQKRDVMLFKDTTVSRKHFEIAPVSNNLGKYAIRDLGSAGGTFIRIQAGQKKQLHAGMMLLLGKHQFIVSSIDDTGSTSGQSSTKSQEAADFDNDYPDHPNGSSANVNDSVTSDTNLALAELISHTEQLVADLSCTDSNVESQYELEKRLREFNLKVRESFKNGSSGDRRRSISSANEEKEYANSKDSRDGDEKIEAEEKAGRN